MFKCFFFFLNIFKIFIYYQLEQTTYNVLFIYGVICTYIFILQKVKLKIVVKFQNRIEVHLIKKMIVQKLIF